MTPKEIQQQAKEYGMTVEEIKEYRKHIKPFLRFSIKQLNKDFKVTGNCFGICSTIEDYIEEYNAPDELFDYLGKRLKYARPKNSFYMNGFGVISAYWWGKESRKNKDGLKKRVDFLKLQLKIVKP